MKFTEGQQVTLTIRNSQFSREVNYVDNGIAYLTCGAGYCASTGYKVDGKGRINKGARIS